MKITSEGAATLVTNLVAIATMLFGMSQDTADVLTKAAPTIVGGIMATATVITYLVNKRKERIEVFNAAISRQSDGKVAAKSAEDHAIEVGRRLGMV